MTYTRRHSMKLEIKITGQADDPRAIAQVAINAVAGAGMEGGRANVSYGNVQSSDPIFPEEVQVAEEEVEVAVEEEQASVMAVGFASSKAALLADQLNVPASAFVGVVPSGVRGYTIGDVKALARG